MNTLFLSVRVLHILLGATWLGAAVVVSLFLLPAIEQAGPDGGKVVAGMIRRKFDKFIPSIGGMTVLTGFYLYWHYTDGFDPATSASMGGRVFCAGGILGTVALIIAGSVVAKNMRKVVALMKQAGETTDAHTRAPLLEQAGQLRRKAGAAGRIVAVLLIVTIVLMALGHYV
jgi:hypothetical protein